MKRFCFIVGIVVLACLLASCAAAGAVTEGPQRGAEVAPASAEPVVYPQAEPDPILGGDTVAEQIASTYTLVRSATDFVSRVANALYTLKDAFPGVKTGNDAYYQPYDKSLGLATSKREILVGNTNRTETVKALAGLGPMDYTIRVDGAKIVIAGGSSFATVNAVNAFIQKVQSGEISSLDQPYEFTYVFWDLYEKNPFIAQAQDFVPVWMKQFKSPGWVGDFYETIYAVSHDNCRVSTYAHRGDMIYYPENSLEGFYSAYLAGVDVIETDFRFTKDGIPVLMHDRSLKRTTNASDYVGRAGFPDSYYVDDWTYEQLTCLRLKMYEGDLTESRIPTLYEALELMANKVIFILEDKESVVLDKKADMYAYAKATGAYGCFLKELKNTVPDLRTWASYDDADESLKSLYEYVSACFSDGLGAFGTLTVFWYDPDITNWSYLTRNESDALWQKYVDQGKRFIGTNQIVAMCQYFAKSMKKADYSKVLKAIRK